MHLLQRFSQVLDTLDGIIASKNDQVAVGLRNLLLKPRSIKGLRIMADVLTIFNVLSKSLQERNIPFLKISSKVAKAKQAVADLLTGCETPHRVWYKPDVEADLLKVSEEREMHTRHSRLSSSSDVINIPKFKQSLINELDSAFEVNDVLKTFDVFNPEQ